MNYIIFNKKDLRVYHILSKPPVDFSNILDIARCEEIPKGDFAYFTVYNLAVKTEKYTEVKQNPVTKTDEEGNEYESYEDIEVEKTCEYKVCDLIGHKRETVDTRSYSEKVVAAIREKYSIDEELAIQRQRDTKPEEFQEYFEYCEFCKKQIKEGL